MLDKETQDIVACLQNGPMLIGDLIAELGYDGHQTMMDLELRPPGLAANVFKPLHGSFLESSHQQALGNLVDDGRVKWRRDAKMNNWYALPQDEFPSEAAERTNGLREFYSEVLGCLSDDDRDALSDPTDPADIGDDDCWVEFCPFVLSMDEDGWELADGDPICNWAGNTFAETYPLDVEPKLVAEQIATQLKERRACNPS